MPIHIPHSRSRTQAQEFRSFSSVQNTGKIGRSSAQPLMRFHSVQPSAVPEHVNTNNATTVRRLSKSNVRGCLQRLSDLSLIQRE